MGRNAAFGRASQSERIRQWWNERDRTVRQNVLLAVGVGVLFVAIIVAAVNRDPTPKSSRVISSRPQSTTTTLGFTPSTVFVGNLGGAGTATAAELLGVSTTTTPTTALAPAPSVAPTTRPAPQTATTVAPASVTTVTNPTVIYTDVPPETTTTRPPATTTTRAPTTTVAPTTTTTALTLPVSLPPLLGP